jgi:hypothetical protein
MRNLAIQRKKKKTNKQTNQNLNSSCIDYINETIDSQLGFLLEHVQKQFRFPLSTACGRFNSLVYGMIFLKKLYILGFVS